MDFYFGQNVTLEFPLGISWLGSDSYNPPKSGSNLELTWERGIGEIQSQGLGILDVSIFGTIPTPNPTSSGIVDRGNWTRASFYVLGVGSIKGFAQVVPTVRPATLEIGSGIITSSSGLITVAVYELKNHLRFSDAISHLRGRVLFGYPKATVIRQVFEMSNSRSLVIPNVPEDPDYAVFLTTTDFNLKDEEIKRGTVDLTFSFDHDLRDIKKISVWIRTPEGFVQLDRMKVFDYPGGVQEPHILYEPFKNTVAFSVPIHCISKKENEFYVELEFKDSALSELDERSRTMTPKENYTIPFQAHFDNRMPYLNIADHAIVNGPQASYNTLFSFTYEPLNRIYCIPDEDLNQVTPGSANNNIMFTNQYEEITRIFLVVPDDLNTITHGGSNQNTYFISEFTELSFGQIGG
jgi:hypothetical protein